MKQIFPFFLFVCVLTFGSSFGDTTIWSGKVPSDGSPTEVVKLNLGKKYIIKASGTVNLGKWWQKGKPLNEDACFEFSDEVAPSKLDTFKNSMQISICDGKYHPDHVYQSEPFVAAQSGIHFWIQDIDYSDNKGELQVEVIELSK